MHKITMQDAPVEEKKASIRLNVFFVLRYFVCNRANMMNISENNDYNIRLGYKAKTF